MASPIIRQGLEERLLQEMESAREEYNFVSQEFILFIAGSSNGSFVATNVRRFVQFMTQHRTTLDRYSAALLGFHSLLINKVPKKDCGAYLTNNKYNLTNREQDVLRLLMAGHSTKLVARDLGISFKTVNSHRHHIMMKMDVHETASMVRKALFAGFGWDSGGSDIHVGSGRAVTKCA
jgi:DNA-binding CsgD family transcriptional regulator